MSDDVKLVPALCTQCGGKLTVDPLKEEAQCPFCGASFMVQKAIQNYNVQNATIEHVDKVNIDMSGTVHSVLDFVGQQMSESREMKREMRKELKEAREESNREFQSNFVKIAIPFFIIFFVFAGVMMFFLNRNDDGTGYSESASGEGEVEYDVERGRLYLDIANPGNYNWEFDDFNSRGTNLDSTKERDGLHFEISGDNAYTRGYAVLHWSLEDDFVQEGYMIYELEIDDGDIVDVMSASDVDDISEYTFYGG